MRSDGLPPNAWLNSRGYSRILRTLAAGGEEAVATVARYAELLAPMVGTAGLSDRRVLAKHIVTVEIARERGAADLERDLVRTELRLVQPLHAFLEAGRQVFEFDDALVAELSRTDVTDVYPSDIHVPYGAFYLRLPNALPPVEGYAVDGILIQHRDYQDVGRSLVLDFMPAFTTADDMARAIAAMPIAIVPLHGEDSLGAEIEVANWKLAGSEFLADGARRMGVSHDGQEWYQTTLESTRRRYEAGAGYVQGILPLLVNALLFVDNCHAEQRTGWSGDAPEDLVRRADSGGPGSAKAEQRLMREGWTRVTLCQTEHGARDPSAEEGSRSVRAHWRRGHWRRQPTGPGRSRVTLVRVRPTMVGTGPTPEGRTYVGRRKDARRHDEDAGHR